jgi:hypothetical protein
MMRGRLFSMKGRKKLLARNAYFPRTLGRDRAIGAQGYPNSIARGLEF